MLAVVVARSSCVDSAIRYVLPVLWVTSCFLIMGTMALGVSNIDLGAVVKKVIKSSNIFARWRHTFDLVTDDEMRCAATG